MAGFLIVVALVVIVLGFVAAVVHIQLVATANHCDEAWANVVSEFHRRNELVPELQATVEAHAASERQLLADLGQVAALADRLDRRAATDRVPSADDVADETRLEAELDRLLTRTGDPARPPGRSALRRGPPPAGDDSADRVQSALRFYNGNVRAHNNTAKQYPGRIVAALGNQPPRTYFRLEAGNSPPSPRVGP